MMLLFFSLFISISAKTQINPDSTNFIIPVKIPVYFSGNFGELRASHFHAGIDIKTQGKTGIKVFSIEDGYIYRISISSGGYGNALYIRHPNGYSSIYAHLETFSQELEEFVLKTQYENQQFDQNIFPAKSDFPVKRGELIGLTGNSGRSGGPHLHFEIRDSSTEEPLNPFAFFPQFKDSTPPVLNRIALYPLNSNSFINGKNEKLIISANELFKQQKPFPSASGEIGFGIDATEYLSGSNNKCGLYTIELRNQNEVIFRSQIDRLNFSQNRYILTHIDYEAREKDKFYLQKSFLQANNSLGIYDPKTKSKGFVSINDTLIYSFEYRIKDFHGNELIVPFHIRGELNPIEKDNSNEDFSKILKWDETNSLQFDSININIPAKSLFDNLVIDVKQVESDSSFCSPIFQIHNKYTPLFRPINLEITYRTQSELMNKLVVVLLDTIKNEASMQSLGGSFEKDGIIKARSYNFGYFAVALDTSPPIAKILNPVENYGTKGRLEIFAKDDLSGIDSFHGFIDDTWVLFRYDAKYDYFYHLLDDITWERERIRELRFVVEDKRGNRSELRHTFFY